MGATARERYAVVSCHVERPLDDAVWARFVALQRRRPSGFRDRGAHAAGRRRVRRGRDVVARAGTPGCGARAARPPRALDRARTTRGPRAPTRASACSPREPECASSASLRRSSAAAAGTRTTRSSRPVRSSATSTARLGHADLRTCARASAGRHSPQPAVVELPSGRTLAAIPTTHSLGDLARALPRRDLPELVHVYFHDTDLLDARRRALLRVALPALARRARVTDLDALAARSLASAPRVAWDDVARL